MSRGLGWHWWCGFFLFLAGAQPGLAHPPGDSSPAGPASDSSHNLHDHAGPAQVVHRSSGVILPEMPGQARPWSSQPVLSDPQRFHFAVMTDNTGGHRKGIWMHGVQSLNLLRPDFVVSVGDLIEGYSDDADEIEREWKEFLGFIDQLQMKFFFVAGNHDVTNPLMHKIWRQHFGAEWYSFDYRDVHFVCLCSEDPHATLGPDQLSWVQKDLAEHVDARWTFVFFHKPLWVYAEQEIAAGNPDPTQWKQVETWLGKRPHTVFAGHVHHYVQFQRNGTQYYQLATTGGSSQLRGQAYGEFDHVAWVTMEQDGPHIANILLDGVLGPDVVTEESMQRFRQFLNQMQLAVAPILIETDADLQAGEIVLQLDNAYQELVTVEGQIQGIPLQGLTMEPERFATQIPPHGRQVVRCQFKLEKPLDLDQFRHTTLSVLLRSGDVSPMQAEMTIPVTIDRHHACPRLAVQIDGNLGEWSGRELAFSEKPGLFGAKEQWQGTSDAGLRFRTAYGDEHFYLSGEVVDDVTVPYRDRLVFTIDARELAARQKDPDLGAHSFSIELEPTGEGSGARVDVDVRRGQSFQLATDQFTFLPTATGYRFELAVPITLFTEPQGKDWQGFQLNAVLRDIDELEDADVYVFWRPALDIQEKNTNFAFFRRIRGTP